MELHRGEHITYKEVLRFYTKIFLLFAAIAAVHVHAQEQSSTAPGTESSASADTNNKRIFWIVPNFRTAAMPNPYKPISTKEKFTIATQDSFDRGTFVLAGLFAAEAQLTNASPSFGQGMAGYARYYGTSLADFVIGDYMTEAICPTLFHQDPRYFRRGTGGGWSRFGYAMGQVVLTHGDNGHTQFNFSEILGNSAASAISNAYYPDNRDVTDAVIKLATQLGVDAAANVLKEFWPDVHNKFKRKHASSAR